MNSNLKSLFVGVLMALVAGYFGGWLATASHPLGGTVHFFEESFPYGIKAGTSNVEVISSAANYDGAISTSKSATLSGTNTFSGATTLSGASTTVANVSTSSATLAVGVTGGLAGAGRYSGCLILGDSANATGSQVYITATGATISATTTKPTACTP